MGGNHLDDGALETMIEIKRPIQRKTTGHFKHYGCPVVVELLPGDVIRLKEYGRRLSSAVSIDAVDLYEMLVIRRAFRERMERAKQRKQRTKKK